MYRIPGVKDFAGRGIRKDRTVQIAEVLRCFEPFEIDREASVQVGLQFLLPRILQGKVQHEAEVHQADEGIGGNGAPVRICLVVETVRLRVAVHPSGFRKAVA